MKVKKFAMQKGIDKENFVTKTIFNASKWIVVEQTHLSFPDSERQ